MAVTHARPVVSLLLFLTVMAISAPLRAQSLADVAKKEEERRKALPSPAKVYTNKDLSAAPPGTPPSGATATPSQADAGKSAADIDKAVKDVEGKGNGSVRDRAYWAGRRKVLQDKLDRDQTFLEALQTRINSLAADVVNRDDPAQRAVLERERLKAVSDLGRLQQEIQSGKKAIADLDEEGRRAGVPAGWLR